MAIQYFPRLDESHAIKITEELVKIPVAEASKLASFTHDSSYYYPTAAHFVSEETLKTFRSEVIEIADDLGFPAALNTNDARALDHRLSRLLFQKLELVEAEAGNAEIWNFLALVVLPDITKWRYPNEKNVLDYNRWLGGDRNVLRKLWWREATLGNELNSQIGEDEAVAIMERPLLGGQPLVARAMVKALLEVGKNYPAHARSDLMRAGAVNLRRYAPFTAFEIFEEEEIESIVLEIFRDSSLRYVEQQQRKKNEAEENQVSLLDGPASVSPPVTPPATPNEKRKPSRRRRRLNPLPEMINRRKRSN